MSDRKISSFELSRALTNNAVNDLFDKFVKEVDPHEIPVKYIEYVTVTYKDDTKVNLTRAELHHPIPVYKGASWENIEGPFKKIKGVRVFIDTSRLATDVNLSLETLLGDKLRK